MTTVFPQWQFLLAFLLASLVLAVTPGPGVFYIVTRSISQGRAHGMASVAGVASGNFGNAIAASIGLAAILSVSQTAFLILKYAGAAYLVYLGIRALRGDPTASASLTTSSQSLSTTYRDGLVVALFNPKTTIFFAAFLPQFVQTDHSAIVQSVALGALFVLIAATTDSAYALSAGILSSRLSSMTNARRYGRFLVCGAYMGLGAFTALTGARSAK